MFHTALSECLQASSVRVAVRQTQSSVALYTCPAVLKHRCVHGLPEHNQQNSNREALTQAVLRHRCIHGLPEHNQQNCNKEALTQAEHLETSSS